MMAALGTWRSLVSALVWGTRGRRFKSGRPDHDVHQENALQRIRMTCSRGEASLSRGL